MLTLDPIYEGIEEEDRLEIDALPRDERLPRIAKLRNLDPSALVEELADLTGLPVDRELNLVENPGETMPLRLIHEYQCLPVMTDEELHAAQAAENGEPLDPADADGAGNGAADSPLPLVTLWPPDEQMDRWVYAVCGRAPEWRLGHPELVSNTITQRFGVGADSLEDSDIATNEDSIIEDEEDEDAAVIRFVNEVVHKAVADRATDIHFEPHRDALQIRYRIDGQLVPIRVPDNLRRFQDAIISRIKIMAKLNISEKRRPQDGRITFGSGASELDIRLSTFPTMYGESISLRLLNQKSTPLSMRELGLTEEEETVIDHALSTPHGIILVTGPTGSGKSTSLTAFIRRINAPERRIITVEDPVEYEVPGVNQTQVHSEIGLTFATSLRAVLRQDPDVIMVGEIRDRETADIAIRASLTGHLVLSTLHTNDAPGALTRLIDMEIEPFLIASSVEMIIAQRLVRRLCKTCAAPVPDLQQDFVESCLATMGIPLSEAQYSHLIKGKNGCERCNQLGFRGRVGMFEILRVTDEMHELIVKRASAREIRKVAVSQGMRSLVESGWSHVKNGDTTIEEVMRYAEPDLDDEE